MRRVIAAVSITTSLLLAAAGVYGVVSQSVTQRTNEIGIRIALGASNLDVWRLVVRQAMVPVLVGLGVGLGGALAGGQSRLEFP